MGIEDLALEMRLQKTLAILKELGVKRKKKPRSYQTHYIIDVASMEDARNKLDGDERFGGYDWYYETHYRKHHSHDGMIFVNVGGLVRYFVLREDVDVNS